MSSAWLVVEYFMLSCHLTSASESISYDVSQLSKLCSTQSSQVVCIPLKDACRQLRHEESIQPVGFHAAAWGEAAHEVPEYPAGCAGVSRYRNSWWGVLVQQSLSTYRTIGGHVACLYLNMTWVWLPSICHTLRC